MNILIIDSSLPESPLAEKVIELEHALKKAKHKYNTVHLHELKIRFCRGCFICWWKTPGLCVIPDDMPDLYEQIMASKLVIFATEMKMGFIDSSTKKVQDRMITLLHPYFEIVDNEFHHRKRYPDYPKLALFIQEEEDTTPEELQLVHNWFKRFSINFKSTVKFVHTTKEPITSIGYEIDHH